MDNYSKIIDEMMVLVDIWITDINQNSIDRSALRSAVLRELCVQIKAIATMDITQRQNVLQKIFRDKLLEQIIILQKKK